MCLISGDLSIVVVVRCPDSRSIRRVIGTGGAIIKRISEESGSVLASLLNVPVNLTVKALDAEKKTNK
jgi:GTPase Era involved in 16S rRNA processing